MDVDLLIVLFTDAYSLMQSSLSCALLFSQGRAAIHRSNQLHPQWGLFGSMNVWFEDFEEFFHVCCFRKCHASLLRNHIMKVNGFFTL